MATKYNFRILIKTKQGKEFSYYSSSFFNSEVDTNFALSSSQVWNRITSSVSCSYQHNYKFDDSAGDAYKMDENFADNTYLSSSLSGSAESGSVNFIYNGVKSINVGALEEKDKLQQFKFFGAHVCNVLNLHEDFWYKPEKLRFEKSTGANLNPNSFIKANVEADTLAVTNHLEIAQLGGVSSDIPFKMDGTEFSRWIRFIQMSGSDVAGNELPKNDLLIGYDNEKNRYMISSSADADFDLIGVNNLEVTHFTSSYQTSSVRQIFTEITSSGNSQFGDEESDVHKFTGDITASGHIHGGPNAVFGKTNIGPGVAGGGPALTVRGNTNVTPAMCIFEHWTARDTRIAFCGPDAYASSTNTKALVGWDGSANGFAISATPENHGDLQIGVYDGAQDEYRTEIFAGGGNVGIWVAGGQTSSLARLTVEGGISASGVNYSSASVIGFPGTTQAGQFGLTVEGSITASNYIYQKLGKYHYWGQGTQNSIRMYGGTTGIFHIQSGSTDLIAASGSSNGNAYVGIGTGVTSGKALTVAGDISASGDIYLEPNQRIQWGNTTRPSIRAANNAEFGDIQFYKHNTQLDMVLSGSNLGIGTANPSKRLTVAGDISASGDITSSGVRVLQGSDVYTAGYQVFNAASDNAGYFWQKGNKTMISGDGSPLGIVLDDAGNVGIGNENPTETLTVEGDISASGVVYARRFESSGSGDSIDIVDSIDVTGNITASGTISASGKIYANRFELAGGQVVLASDIGDSILHIGTGTQQIQVQGPTSFSSVVTASLGISSSGYVSASSIQTQGDIKMPTNANLIWRNPQSNNCDLSMLGSGELVIFHSASSYNSGQTAMVVDTQRGGILVGSSGGTFGSLSSGPGHWGYNALTVQGGISGSNSLFLGSYYGSHLSASNGNLQLSGSGNAKVEITGSIDTTQTGSFGRIECTTISASSGEFDTGTVYIGGESINKTLVQNLKRGYSSDVVSPAGETYLSGKITASGDLVISGNITPTHDASRTAGFYLGAADKRFKGIYLASTIDVSGSQLVISPSASVAAGESFSVLISGSVLPANTGSDSLGSLTQPFKDVYVTTGSMVFVDKGVKQQSIGATDIERLREGKFPRPSDNPSETSRVEIKATGGMQVTGSLGNKVVTFTAGDTTPDVSGGNIFKTNNDRTNPADIIRFDNGKEGQIIHVLINDIFTDFTHGVNLKLFRGIDADSLTTNDIISFLCIDGTTWYELNRQDNS